MLPTQRHFCDIEFCLIRPIDSQKWRWGGNIACLIEKPVLLKQEQCSIIPVVSEAAGMGGKRPYRQENLI